MDTIQIIKMRFISARKHRISGHLKTLVVFIGMIFLVQYPLDAQDTSGSDLFEEGMDAFEQGDLVQAEKAFQSLLDQNRRSASGHYGIGRVFLERTPGSTEALEHFQEATRLDADLWDAWYYLAITYMQRDDEDNDTSIEIERALSYLLDNNSGYIDAWLLLADLRERNERWEGAVGVLGRAVRQFPQNDSLYHKYMEKALWYDQQENAIETIRDLMGNNTEQLDWWLDLAKCYFQMGDYSTSLALLDSVNAMFSRIPVATVSLLEAKNYFLLQQDADGNRSYTRALENIRDSSQAERFFQDVQYIMNAAEYRQLQSVPVSDLVNFYKHFWISRDPDLPTEANERIPEHYRRVQYARLHYRRYIDDCTYFYDQAAVESAKLLKSIPMKGYELLEPYSSPALQNLRDVDDAGLIYIRHGEPDIEVTGLQALPLEILPEDRDDYDPADIPQNISWRFNGTTTRAPLIYHFVRYSEKCGWLMESQPFTFANRSELSATYGDIETLLDETSPFADDGPSFSVNPELQTRVQRLTRDVMEQTVNNAETGLQTETTEYEFPEEAMTFPTALLNFKGGAGNNLIELYYLIPGSETKLDSTMSAGNLHLEKFLGLYNQQWNEVIHSHLFDTKFIPLSPDEWENSQIVVREEFRVPPGEYHYAIQVKDRTSERLGRQRGSVTAPRFTADSLMMSDVLVSGPIQPAGQSSTITKGNLAIQPHMFSAFGSGDIIGIYFEVYNLETGSGGSRYEVSTTIREPDNSRENRGFFQRLFGGGGSEVTTSQEYSGNDTDDIVFLNYNLGARNPGSYELIIRVRDLLSGDVSEESVPITIATQ